MSVGLRGLDPRVREKAEQALAWAARWRVPVTVTSARRSRREQEQLYRRYLKGQSRWPAARPGESLHETGRAWDSWVPRHAQGWWTAVRQALGFRVPAHDWPHAEF